MNTLRKLLVALPIIAGCSAPAGDYAPDESNEGDSSTGGQNDTGAPATATGARNAMTTGGSTGLATGGSDVVGATGGSDVVGATGGSDVVGATGGSDVVGATGGGNANCDLDAADHYLDCMSNLPIGRCEYNASKNNCSVERYYEINNCYGGELEAYHLCIAACYETSRNCYENISSTCTNEDFTSCLLDEIDIAACTRPCSDLL